MSLFAALTVAVGGLKAQSSAIGNISDNLSNSNTVGFKRIETRFESLVTQSNDSVNDPGGVRASPIYLNNVQGNLQQSQFSTSLALSGDGFFEVQTASVGTGGALEFSGTNLYTRRGDFLVNKDGYLVNGAGYYLSGYTVDPDTLDRSAETDPIQISSELALPVPTSIVTYEANLPASAAAGAFPSSTVLVFDELGDTHELIYTWTKTSTANQWTLNVACADGATSLSGNPALNHNITFTFGSGASGTVPGTIDSVSVASGSPFTVGSSTTDVTLSVPLDFGVGSQSITLNFGEYDTAGGVTQFADDNLQVTSFEQNGIPGGSFRDLEIDEDGFVTLNYDNGRARTLYQIPVVLFNAPNRLQREDGGAFSRTQESGSPNVQLANQQGAGGIVGNALEGSNVDIADEFTKIIQSQRIYSANARMISTTNSMLEEVVNVIR